MKAISGNFIEEASFGVAASERVFFFSVFLSFFQKRESFKSVALVVVARVDIPIRSHIVNEGSGRCPIRPGGVFIEIRVDIPI